jgi:hypothetical protein
VNDELTAPASPPPEADNVFAPVWLILKSLKVARPEPFVAWVVVPESIPVPEASASATLIPAAATLLLEASWSCTVTGGAIGAPAIPLLGC